MFNPNPMAMNPMLSKLQQDSLFQRAQQMAQGKSEQELRQTAMNLCNSMGIDINQAFAQFQKQFGGTNFSR